MELYINSNNVLSINSNNVHFHGLQNYGASPDAKEIGKRDWY